MNKIGKVFIGIGGCLILVSSLMLIYGNYEEVEAGVKASNVLSVMKDSINKNMQTSVKTDVVVQMPTIRIGEYDYIGTIIIPRLNLELPVMAEYDYDRLKIAPARYYGSIRTNDLIICAHSYRTHFKYLSSLEQGDKIIIMDVNGNNYIYEVLEIEVLSSDDVLEMINNEFDLTLYTCTEDGIDRVTVRCNRVSDVV